MSIDTTSNDAEQAYSGVMPGAIGSTTYQPSGMTHYDPVHLGISYGGDHQASDNRARLTRAQWADYQKRFAPIEDELIGQIGNADYYAGQVNNAVGDVARAYAAQPAQQERYMGGYGVHLDADQMADQERQYGLNRAAAMTQAANQTRTGLKARDIDIMAGGIVPADQVKKGGA